MDSIGSGFEAPRRLRFYQGKRTDVVIMNGSRDTIYDTNRVSLRSVTRSPGPTARRTRGSIDELPSGVALTSSLR